jgi:hypothetical protein
MKYKNGKIYRAGWKNACSMSIALRYLDNVVYSIKHAGSDRERDHLIDKACDITQTMMCVEAYGRIDGKSLNSLRRPVLGRRSKNFEFIKLLEIGDEVGECDE